MRDQTVVLGVGFGDEGKGTVVDYLCHSHFSFSSFKFDKPLVVRFSGGNQVSHTVGRNSKHVFSNFGSGTIAGAPTYWSRFCSVNPTHLLNELDVLLEKGIKPLLFIDINSPIVTPYDIGFNKSDIMNLNDGTCGLGYGKTVVREESFYHLSFGDLFYPAIFKAKYDAIKVWYEKKGIVGLDDKIFLEDCVNVTKVSDFVKLADESILGRYDKVIFEGSQGLLLDQHYGFFPNVTRANTGTTNIKNWIDADTKVILVSRSYQTRHGNGFMTNFEKPHNIYIDPTESNKDNPYQGIFRRSLLDVDLINYAKSKDDFVRNSKNVSLAVTCLDHSSLDLRFTYQDTIFGFANEIIFLTELQNFTKTEVKYVSHSSDGTKIQSHKN
jgi:adenylosuccinate synthase